MKKIGWFLVIFAALSFVFVGCPSGGTTTTESPTLAEAFPNTVTTQDNAAVTLGENSATFTFTGAEMWGEVINDDTFDASDFTGIRFEYKATSNATIFAQDDNTIFIFATASDGWGAIASADSWEELVLPFSILVNQGWFNDGEAPFNKSAILKLAFQITGEGTLTFELRNFSFY